MDIYQIKKTWCNNIAEKLSEKLGILSISFFLGIHILNNADWTLGIYIYIEIFLVIKHTLAEVL